MFTWKPLQDYTKIKVWDAEEPIKQFPRAGVYIWGFKDDNGLFWPYYVGKHRNVPYRLCEHLSNLKGGVYNTYAPSALFAEGISKSFYSINLGRRIDFIADANPVDREYTHNMICRFHFTSVIIDDDKYKEQGDDLERTTIKAIKAGVLVNTKGGKINSEQDLGNLFEVLDPLWKS
jgi:hypothetical protein